MSCSDGVGLKGNSGTKNTLMTYDDVLGVDKTTYEPVWIWNRIEEFGDYSAQIPVGEHQMISKSSNILIDRGFQGDSEAATMVTYVATEQNAVLIAKHAQLAISTDKTLSRLIALAGDDME
jgi:hypothetical protein